MTGEKSRFPGAANRFRNFPAASIPKKIAPAGSAIESARVSWKIWIFIAGFGFPGKFENSIM
jgi:hypothetical protein